MTGIARRYCGILAIAGSILLSTVFALINPSYTLVSLVRDNGQVLVLRVSAPKDGQMKAEVVEAIVGEMPAWKTVVLDYSAAEDLPEENVTRAFGGATTALGVMCVQKNKKDGPRLGALEIGNTWMGMAQADAQTPWKLDKDPNDLETVWGGSVRYLIPAIRYAIKDPGAEFPVVASMTWGNDLALGTLTGPARGCLRTRDGVILLSDGGDRVYQPGVKGAAPVDVTAKVGLTSKSKAMVAGDFNGDGRLDLVSWDGSRLWLLLQGEDGKYAAPIGGYELTECRSLTRFGGGLIVGGSKRVIQSIGTGSITSSVDRLTMNQDIPVFFSIDQLPTDLDTTDLGPGGISAVADFTDDGVPDIVQVFAKGFVLYPGDRKVPGKFASPVVTRIAVVRNPVAVVCGDFDADGQLDMVVAGEGGSALLSRVEGGAWASVMAETGELGAASGLGQGDTTVIAACASDLNGDGRQAVALFDAKAGPGLYFSRGFSCFGVARNLTFSETKVPAAEALGQGQEAGILVDMNGDLVPDLLAVDREHKVWVIFGEAKDPRRFHLTLSMADVAKGPLTVTVSMGQRPLGMYVVRPGEPVSIGLPKAGKVTLAWKAADGTVVLRDVAVMGPKQVEL